MPLTKPGYRTRMVDSMIADRLSTFGAVLIEGPKWCGKTWASLHHAESVTYILDPGGNYSNREKARLNPSLILDGACPHVIDEWQEVPGIWDAVRFAVDQDPNPGRFILTGSITPPRDSYVHSGAGRFAVVRMRPMTLFESGDSTGAVSFGSLLNGDPIEPLTADIALSDLIDVTIRGGWPATLNLPGSEAGQVSIEYLRAIVRNDLFDGGFSRRNPAKLRRLLHSLARNNSTTVSDSTLSVDTDGANREEQTKEEILLSRGTVSAYLRDLMRIFVIEEIPGWSPRIRSRARIRMSPKRVFSDPSLAIASLGLSNARLSRDLNTFGFMFENLCLRDIAAYCEHLGGSLYHYRDNSGLEADAIVEMPDGSWGAVEIKLGEHQVGTASKNLIRLKDKMVAAGVEPPTMLAVITGGGFGRQQENGIYVIPLNALAP